ncbi:MAG: hypothetical protein ACYDB2_01815 [Acidimicrobiales bacterium]
MMSAFAGASALAMVAGLTLASVGSASAASLTPHAAPPLPCNVTVTGAGTAVPGQTLIVGVVAGTTVVTFNCNTASGAGVAAEASLLAAIGTAGVIPSTEADTSALGTFAPSATSTGCPAGSAGSCSIATFTVPATFATSDPNGVCPPTPAQINAGLFGCAIAVASTQLAPVVGAEYLIQYASQSTPPSPPTIQPLQTTGSEGSLINVSDATGNTAYWWGSAVQAVQASAAGATPAIAPNSCTGVGYGNAPAPYLADVWFVTGTSTAVGGGAASGVTISNDCYNGKTLSPPVLGGTIAVPANVVSGTAYTVVLCEVNTTPYPSNDASAAAICGAGAPSWIDASFSFTAKAKVISQNLPVTNTVATGTSSSFKDQLVTSGNQGTVSYTQSTGSPSVAVSSSGAVSTSGALKPGTYTATGTSTDASGDAGTFSYALVVTGTAPPTVKPAPKALKVSGVAVPGRTVVIAIIGRNFTGGPRVTGPAGTIATVLRATSSRLTVRVKESPSLRKGTYALTIKFASGKRTRIRYTIR